MTDFANLIGEAVWVSQFNPNGTDVGIFINIDGEPSNPDGNVTVTMTTLPEGEEEPEEIFSRAADNPEAGVFSVVLSGAEAKTVGFYRLEWTYEVDSEAQLFVHALEIVPSSRALESLPEEFYPILDSVWMRTADLFDSPYGGPHLQVYYQTRFNRGRVAELIGTAVRRLNVIAQPHMTYTLDGVGGKVFPLLKWGGVLELGTFVEVIKHLMRSYVEQPDTPGVNVARLSRRDYLQRWETILRIDQADYDEMLDSFKIAHMGLGKPTVLVSGGIFGQWAPTRISPFQGGRPRFHWRYH